MQHCLPIINSNPSTNICKKLKQSMQHYLQIHSNLCSNNCIISINPPSDHQQSITRTIIAVRQNKHKTEAFTALKITSAGCLGSSWRYKLADFDGTTKSITRANISVKQEKHNTEAFIAIKITSAEFLGCSGSSWKQACRLHWISNPSQEQS